MNIETVKNCEFVFLIIHTHHSHHYRKIKYMIQHDLFPPWFINNPEMSASDFSEVK